MPALFPASTHREPCLWQIDHIHPRANGGDDSIFNYVLVEGPVNRFWRDNLGKHKRRAPTP